MAEIVEVVNAGKGWTQVKDAEGNVYKLEGARNWRNNNPGNIEYGDFAKSLGAVGSDGRFAVFPSYETGRQAKEQLIFSSPKYRDLTLEQAISRYAPPNENNTSAYLNQVVRGSGVSPSTPMSQIPASVRGAILDTMEQVEGFKVGRTYNADGIPLPPAEIPNTVASALSVTPPPRIAPTPATASPDLAQMRDPVMSSSARNAQVTPSANTSLPRPRPSAPDIVTPTMASLSSAPRPSANTRRAADTGLLSLTPVTPRLTAAGDNIMSYHIPDINPTTITGGLGSLTPTQQRARLPEVPRTVPGQSQIERIGPTAREIASAPGVTIATVPTSGVGQPPATRTVQAIPWQTPKAQAVPPAATANAFQGSAVNNIAMQRAEQRGQRSPSVPMRLSPGVAAQNYDVGINGPAGLTRPQYAALPQPSAPISNMANVPPPRPRPAALSSAPRPSAPVQRVAQQSAPLRVAVQGANSYNAAPQQTTLVRALQNQGMSASQAYDAANAQAAQRARDNASSPAHVSSNSWFNEVTGR